MLGTRPRLRQREDALIAGRQHTEIAPLSGLCIRQPLVGPEIVSGQPERPARALPEEHVQHFRAAPFAQRLSNNPDTSKLFSSAIHGDPGTPLLRAYVGDTVVFRLLHQLMNESHVWTISGHTFLTERYAGDANRKNSIHVGIAERYDLVTKAGGFQGMPGDYIHFNGRSSHFAEGGWGIVRVLDKAVADLKPLPSWSARRDLSIEILSLATTSRIKTSGART